MTTDNHQEADTSLHARGGGVALQLLQPCLLIIAIAAVAVIFARPAGAAERGFSGTWRVALSLPGGDLPFGLQIRQVQGKTTAILLNPPERMRAEKAEIVGDRLIVAFPSYDARLELRLLAGGKLKGQALMSRSTGPVTVAANGVRGTWRFSPKPGRAAADLSGRWLLAFGTPAGPGLAQLKQAGNLVSGSVQLPSGDTRYLAGEVSGTRLSLSTFDGNAATLWTATLKDGKLVDGRQFTATGSAAGTPWTARRAGNRSMEAVAVERAASARLAFRLPASDGSFVSLSDPRYRGKVVAITLGGAWCPNCHDESVFLGPYAARRQKEGLEVIGLHFEYGDDTKRNFRLIDNYKARYKLPYPLLLAGQPTPESTSALLGALGPVKVYPSTIFIGRDGRVREIHVGWAGPATGALNEKAKRDFDATITRLLREPT